MRPRTGTQARWGSFLGADHLRHVGGDELLVVPARLRLEGAHQRLSVVAYIGLVDEREVAVLAEGDDLGDLVLVRAEARHRVLELASKVLVRRLDQKPERPLE